MQPRDRHGAPYADQDTDEHGGDDDHYDAHPTPPFGVGASAPAPEPAQSVATPATPAAPATPATARFEIRDRLIELDDLRQRGILSEEEFAAKKSELLNRM
jgi:hypothetical protein